MKFGKKILLPIRDRLGPGGRRWAESLRVLAAFLKQGGSCYERECNICGYRGRFYPAGFPAGMQVRMDAGCPNCGSLERHRFLKIWADGNRQLIDGKSVLHFAPERAVQSFIKPSSSAYLTADVDGDKGVDLFLNIENIAMQGECCEVVICSHVLEHVDDRRALSELHRILKPNGILLVMVPIIEAWPETYEDSAVTSGSERLLRFGHRDHLRIYGADAARRLEGAGFAVQSFTAQEPEASRFGLLKGDKIFICTKNSVEQRHGLGERHVA